MEKLFKQPMAFNGNEIVFTTAPRVGVAGIAPDQPDALAEEIVCRWNRMVGENSTDNAIATINRLHEMCEESLDPDTFTAWLKVRATLYQNRNSLNHYNVGTGEECEKCGMNFRHEVHHRRQP